MVARPKPSHGDNPQVRYNGSPRIGLSPVITMLVHGDKARLTTTRQEQQDSKPGTDRAKLETSIPPS